TRVRWELPQQLARDGVERMKMAIARASSEHEAASGGEHRSPIRRSGIVVGPDSLARIHIPRLHLAEMVRARCCEGPAAANADKSRAGRVLNFSAHVRAADVVVGRNINHPRLRAERNRRPVLAPVRVRTEVGLLSSSRLPIRVDVRPAGY